MKPGVTAGTSHLSRYVLKEMEVLAAWQTFYLTAEHAQDRQTYQSQSGFLESRALQELSWALWRTADCAWVESER